MAVHVRRWRHSIINNTFSKLILGIVFIYFYCEYLIYYVTQIQCGWPSLAKRKVSDLEPVHAMIIADIHLLGSRNGHWLDKWRREWQMHRAFQTAITLHQPEVVFVLGDLFDEGKWCSQSEFDDYVERFYRLFKVPDSTTMYAVVGNHDIGFHYRITPHLANRFESKMNAPPVRLVSLRGNHFVLINSMAMEGDGCSLCSRAVAEIDRISDMLKCSSGSALCKGNAKLQHYSPPIVMQHYPLYRESDRVCTEPDAAPPSVRNNLFEERWDCLSKESTEYLVESLRPRAVFGAHTHHSCLVRHSFVPTPNHKIEFIEYTVPSFSWRNRLDPKYYLHCIYMIKVAWVRLVMLYQLPNTLYYQKVSASTEIEIMIKFFARLNKWNHTTLEVTVSPDEVKVAKCELPSEWTMQVAAVTLFIALLLYLKYFSQSTNVFNYKHLSGKKV